MRKKTVLFHNTYFVYFVNKSLMTFGGLFVYIRRFKWDLTRFVYFANNVFSSVKSNDCFCSFLAHYLRVSVYVWLVFTFSFFSWSKMFFQYFHCLVTLTVVIGTDFLFLCIESVPYYPDFECMQIRAKIPKMFASFFRRVCPAFINTGTSYLSKAACALIWGAG